LFSSQIEDKSLEDIRKATNKGVAKGKNDANRLN
jgi:hypothetical protein